MNEKGTKLCNDAETFVKKNWNVIKEKFANGNKFPALITQLQS